MMRKLLLIALAAFAFAACSDDNDGSKKPNNPLLPVQNGSGELHFLDNDYEVAYAVQEYYGAVTENNETEGTVSVAVSFLAADFDHAAVFNMILPDTGNKLVSGTYVFDGTYSDREFTFNGGMTSVSNPSGTAIITGGEIVVARSGENYTVTIDCTAGTESVTGNYSGEIALMDVLNK